jgi:F0F1-type ATP synthase membrane subunit c/vacuolar-type H+-ATPase subunit K
MVDTAYFFYYGTIASVVAINSIGVGLGEGWASFAALEAMDRQPSARSDIVRTMIVGTALIETSAILGIVMAIFLFLSGTPEGSIFYGNLSKIGIACAICCSGFVTGLFAAWPTVQACYAIARQPFFAQKITRIMMITQTIIQTPLIFAFLISLFINTQSNTVLDLANTLRLIGSGLCIGIGSIGPSIGLATFAKEAVRGLGINREAFGKILSFTFISEAIIETPLIFALVVSVLLILTNIANANLLRGIALLAAGLCAGLGTFGPGVSSGRTAGTACNQIALNSEQYSIISRTSMIGQALIESTAIYALLIAILLFLFIY